MKRAVIGSVFMVSGLLITSSLLITATFYVPMITQWRGSKLWFCPVTKMRMAVLVTTSSATIGTLKDFAVMV